MSDYYKRELPRVELSIERATENVPNDGRFYLVWQSKIIGDFSTEKLALQRYKEILAEVGFEPEETKREQISPSQEWLDQYFYAKEIYWGESHKFQEKGGPGRSS